MNQHYPTEDASRIGFWESQLFEAQALVQPYMNAGKRIVNLYNNIPHGVREQDMDNLGPDDVQRVKGSMVFAWVDQSKSNMIDHDPFFRVAPDSAASVGGHDVVERVSNYWYDFTGQLQQDDQMALDAFLLPYAVKKIGWNSVIEHQSDMFITDASTLVMEDPDEENLALLALNITKPTVWQDHELHIDAHIELLQTPGLDPQVMEIVTEHVKHHKALSNIEQPQADTTISWEAPFGSRWQPDDFLMDPHAGMSMKDARWIAWRIRAPLYWWKRQPAYSNTDDLEAGNLSIDPEKKAGSLWGRRPQADENTFGDYRMTEGWEIWARDFPVSSRKNRNCLITFVSGQDKLQRHDEEWPYQFLNDYPGVMLKFQDNIKTYINKPTLAMAGADNIHQLVNEFFDSALYVMRKSKNLHTYDSDLMTKEEFDEIINAPDGSYFGIPGLSSKQGDPIRPIPFFEIQNDKQQFLQTIMGFFDRVAGTPQPIRSPAQETATGASIIERRNTAREDNRLKRYQQMQKETVEKMWHLHQQFLPDRQFLIDPRAKKFASVSEEIARGEYRFSIEVIPSKSAELSETKRWLDLYNILVGSVPAFLNLGQAPPNIAKALELYLVRGLNIRDPEVLLPTSVDAFTQSMQDLVQNRPQDIPMVLEAFKNLSGGGSQGALGGIQPVDSQSLASSPATAVGQQDAANRA